LKHRYGNRGYAKTDPLLTAEGKTFTFDHAPLAIDIDSPGYPFDWASADSRIASRLQKQR